MVTDKMPTDIKLSVIILTLNEELNLPECLASIRALSADIFVVDSGSTDATRELATAAGCQVYEHPFENYAVQRNWAFDNLPIKTEWILCLDADERLMPELVDEIVTVLSHEGHEYAGFLINKRSFFLGKWIRYGGQYPSYHLRLFRTGQGRCENRLYDQHFVVNGKLGKLNSDYVDVIASDLTEWTARHNRWATMEAREILRQMNSREEDNRDMVKPKLFGNPIERKRYLRTRVYQRFPLFVRPFLFWIYGYIFKLGFLDGAAGLIFHTLQRFWFRFLIDAKLYELKHQDTKRGRRYW